MNFQQMWIRLTVVGGNPPSILTEVELHIWNLIWENVTQTINLPVRLQQTLTVIYDTVCQSTQQTVYIWFSDSTSRLLFRLIKTLTDILLAAAVKSSGEILDSFCHGEEQRHRKRNGEMEEQEKEEEEADLEVEDKDMEKEMRDEEDGLNQQEHRLQVGSVRARKERHVPWQNGRIFDNPRPSNQGARASLNVQSSTGLGGLWPHPILEYKGWTTDLTPSQSTMTQNIVLEPQSGSLSTER